LLIAHGTIHEYLTGECDKTVKYVWHFSDDGKLIQEVHDLTIGEKNTQVIEVVFTKKK
jgi:hypothetical protein